MHKEEERKTKQKRRVVNAAPEQENEITQKSGWRSCVGEGWGQGQDPAPGGARTGLAQLGQCEEWGGCCGAPGWPGNGRVREGSVCTQGTALSRASGTHSWELLWVSVCHLPAPKGCVRASPVPPALYWAASSCRHTGQDLDSTGHHGGRVHPRPPRSGSAHTAELQPGS